MSVKKWNKVEEDRRSEASRIVALLSDGQLAEAFQNVPIGLLGEVSLHAGQIDIRVARTDVQRCAS